MSKLTDIEDEITVGDAVLLMGLMDRALMDKTIMGTLADVALYDKLNRVANPEPTKASVLKQRISEYLDSLEPDIDIGQVPVAMHIKLLQESLDMVTDLCPDLPEQS